MENNKTNIRTWVEINKSAVKNNYDTFRKLIDKDCLLMSVVKSNAYGHGIGCFPSLVNEMGVDWIAVDSIVEAEKIRKDGINKPILVLGHTLESKLDSASSKNISLTVADFSALENLKNINAKIKIHIKVDTGMHRQGFFISEIPKVAEKIKETPNIIVEGVYTHFPSAKNPAFPKTTLKQIEEFKKALSILEQFGFKNIIRHAGATSGAVIFPESHFDMVRVGIGLCGMWPSKETKEAFKDKINLTPVLTWKTVVGQIKKLSCGSKIGYDLTEKIDRDSTVAVLPIGYWHGFPRLLSSIGRVLINGKEAKVLGRISMDMTSVDVTDIPGTKVGDEVVIIGKSAEKEISADQIALLSDTINYEIVTCINPLIKRIVV